MAVNKNEFLPSHPIHHGTSSAFSVNANPNEDWTKISDLAERRRIQNRIAQRNYRKKLKTRLNDLELRASSTSPIQSHGKAQKPKSRVKRSQSAQSSESPSLKRKSFPSTTYSNTNWNSSDSELYMLHHKTYNSNNTAISEGGVGNEIGRNMHIEQITDQYSTPSPQLFNVLPPPAYQNSYSHNHNNNHSHNPNVYNLSRESPQQSALQTIPRSHYGGPPREVIPSQRPVDSLSYYGLPPNTIYAKQLNDFSDESAVNPLLYSYASITGEHTPVSEQLQYNQHIQGSPLNKTYSDGCSTAATTSPAMSLSEIFPLTPKLSSLPPDFVIYT